MGAYRVFVGAISRCWPLVLVLAVCVLVLGVGSALCLGSPPAAGRLLALLLLRGRLFGGSGHGFGCGESPSRPSLSRIRGAKSGSGGGWPIGSGWCRWACWNAQAPSRVPMEFN